MLSDRLINVLTVITLVELMLSIGLSASVAQVWQVVTDRRKLVRALVANYILVPSVALLLVILLRPQPMVAAGVMVVAVCPGAPYAPPLAALAKGRVELAVGWMVLLAGTSAVLAPLLLYVLLPLVTRGTPVVVDAAQTLTTLAMVQFLPLCAGMAVAGWGPRWLGPLRVLAARLSVVLNVVLIVVILVSQIHMLTAIRAAGYAGMLALLVGSAAAGLVLGGRDAADRRTLAITTCVRNVGVALVIASTSFPGTPAVTFITAYALFQTVFTAVGVVAMGRRIEAGASTTAPPSRPAITG